MPKVKRLAIIGSTGSIGRQTLEIVRAFPDRLKVVALAAGKNISLLQEQIVEFKSEFYYCEAGKSSDECFHPHLHLSHQGRGTSRSKAKFLTPEEMVSLPEVDTVVVAASGKAGLSPVLAAVRAGKAIALANKESLVAAGEIIMPEAKKYRASILPIDSEHSAIWQCLRGERSKTAKKIILTASGGPFRSYSREHMSTVTAIEALKHPSWKMGKKVTIDSATLMNKGLEVIEAHWLFDMPYENIQVVVHPQSIIHSMVEFVDGSVKAQMSQPDMRLPIQYALSYPERWSNDNLPKLDWSRIKGLSFEQPDFEAFPCLKLAIEAGKKGGTYPAVLCAADEVAVELFLENSIAFTDIPKMVGRALSAHRSIEHPSIEEILEADAWSRKNVLAMVKEAACRS